MFTEHFGFTKNPFNLAADVSCFLIDSSNQELIDTILNDLTSGSSPVVLTGSIGIGKTQLTKYLMSRLPSNIDCMYLCDSSLTYSDRIYALISKLPESLHNDKRPLIILDNAHEIPLETLDFLLNEASEKILRHSSFQLLLVGLSDLPNKIYSIDKDLFSSKMAHFYKMIGLSEQHVRSYVKFRLDQAGYCEKSNGKLFSDGALRIITHASKGIPHSINLLSGAALLITSFENQKQVSPEIAQEATLSCLLPAEIIEEKILASFSNTQLNVLKKPALFGRRHSLRRKEPGKRLKNWKRTNKIHYKFPVAPTVTPVSNIEIAQAKRKRLVAGFTALSLSLCFLIGLQQVDPISSDNQLSKLNSSKIAPTLPNKEQEQIAFSAIQDGVLRQMAKIDIDHVLPKPSDVSTFENELTLASATLADNSAVQPSTNKPLQTLLIKTSSLSDAGTTKKASVPSVIAKTTNSKLAKSASRPEPIRVLARNDLTSTNISGNTEKFETVSAKLFHEPSPSQTLAASHPVSTIMDTQEIATRDRAASRLNLYHLGIEFNVDSLITAAQSGNVHVLKLLLAAGIPADIKNSHGETALIKAASKGFKSAVKELLNAGAHANIKDSQGLTALNHADQNNRSEIKNLLLSHGAQG